MKESIADFGCDYKVRVENAIQQLQAGKGILLVDDEDRENEGDIIYSAEKMSVSDMAIMIRECSGIVCLCLTAEKCKSLDLRMMVEENTSKNQTPFTISIEAKEGTSSGVSASDRICTIKTAISKDARPQDLVSPGHIFPLVASPNGVFDRRGHTEGSVDLVKLAGLGDAAVLCELTNLDGSMARLPEIIAFGNKHGMTVVTIEDICNYRLEFNTQIQ